MKSSIKHANHRHPILHSFRGHANYFQRGFVVHRSQILQCLDPTDYLAGKFARAVELIAAMYDPAADGAQIAQNLSRIVVSSVMLDPGEKQLGRVFMIANLQPLFLKRRFVRPDGKRRMLFSDVVVRAGNENGVETIAAARLRFNYFEFQELLPAFRTRIFIELEF